MTDIDPLVERLHLYGGVRVPEEKSSCSENVCAEAAVRASNDTAAIGGSDVAAAFMLILTRLLSGANDPLHPPVPRHRHLHSGREHHFAFYAN